MERVRKEKKRERKKERKKEIKKEKKKEMFQSKKVVTLRRLSRSRKEKEKVKEL